MTGIEYSTEFIFIEQLVIIAKPAIKNENLDSGKKRGKQQKLDINNPETKPLERQVIKSYSIGKTKGIHNINNAAKLDFLTNVKNEIIMNGKRVKILVINGNTN